MRFKKGNRWRGSKGELRYKTWRRMVFELNKRKVGLSKHYVCVKCKFEALDKPNLLVEYLNGDKAVKSYIRENK